MPDSELFDIQQVRAKIKDGNMAGPPRYHAVCQHCGQMVWDGKEKNADGKVLCRHCAGESYIEILGDTEATLCTEKETVA